MSLMSFSAFKQTAHAIGQQSSNQATLRCWVRVSAQGLNRMLMVGEMGINITSVSGESPVQPQ